MNVLPDDYIQAIFNDLEAKSVIYAKAKALAEGLREDRKITKAQLMKVAEADGESSTARQEVFAYSHPTYQAIVTKLKAAIENEALLHYQLKLLEMRWESWRTINANQRALTR